MTDLMKMGLDAQAIGSEIERQFQRTEETPLSASEREVLPRGPVWEVDGELRLGTVKIPVSARIYGAWEVGMKGDREQPDEPEGIAWDDITLCFGPHDEVSIGVELPSLAVDDILREAAEA